MKEKLNSILEELERVCDSLDTEESNVDNVVSNIEYEIRTLNDTSSELYDLRSKVYELQSTIESLVNECETPSTGYTKAQVQKIVENVINKYVQRIFNNIDGTLWVDLLDEEFSKLTQDVKEEL